MLISRHFNHLLIGQRHLTAQVRLRHTWNHHRLRRRGPASPDLLEGERGRRQREPRAGGPGHPGEGQHGQRVPPAAAQPGLSTGRSGDAPGGRGAN